MRCWLLLMLSPLLLLVGCQQNNGRAPGQGDESPLKPQPVKAGQMSPRDARPDVPMLVELDVYQLSVPLGRISGNEEFWKHLNEQVVDVGVYDALFKNGVRVGMAATAEWDYFRNIIEQYPATSKQMTFRSIPGPGNRTQAAELEMQPPVPRQDLFYYDNSNTLIGRTYDQSQNFLAITFQPAPRKPGNVRVRVCPMVRVMREQLEYSITNEEQQLRFVRPERIYDMSLEADVPPEHFLVVAPSSEGKWPTSIGRSFLVQDGDTEQLEQVLILVPRPMKLADEPKSQQIARNTPPKRERRKAE